MKKQILYIALGGVLLSGGVVHAQSTTTVPGTAGIPAVAQPAKGVPANAKETKKMKLLETVTRLEMSLQARITNLEGVAGKIQARIGKIQQGGGDVTAATMKFAEAQKRITEAKTALGVMKAANIKMANAAKPAVAFGTIKNKLAKDVTVSIKAAHRALVDTVVIMKGQGGARGGSPVTATSSATAQ